jgi:hypothetical protein
MPNIGPTANLDTAQAIIDEYQEAIDKERARRQTLTPAQQLAEKMNFAFTREPGEAWYYEGNDWSKPEHSRWLRKAERVMEKFDDPDEALAFLLSVR